MTVGLVIVSHSAQLAAGVAELACEMAPGVVIALAAGTDDGRLGTSYGRVRAAVENALRTADAALVLADLGSATMTAEMVLEELADERVRLADVPLVEGAIAAAVAARSGAPLDEVLRAAQAAGQPAAAAPPGAVTVAGALQRSVRLVTGLHARPAAALAACTAGFDAQVSVDGADARSLVELMALGLSAGATVTVSASGPQAAAALEAAAELIGGGFGEAP